MRTTRRSLLALGGATAYLATALGPMAAPAEAQAWPERPVTMIVPFPPGGGTDTFARPLAAALGAQLGQTFVVDNRGGAGGTLGAGTAARAEKDGYTLFFGAVHHAIAPGVYPKLAYDIEKDFQPIAVVAVVPQVVVVNPDRVEAKTLGDLIEAAKASPGSLTYGSAGNGTSHHLAGELFKGITGTEIQHVPYKGAGPALQDLIGGQIDMMFDGLGRRPATSSPAPSDPWPSRPRNAPRSCRTCPRPPRLACPATRSTLGTRCGPTRARPRRSSTASSPRSARHSMRIRSRRLGRPGRQPRATHAGPDGQLSLGRDRALGQGRRRRRHQDPVTPASRAGPTPGPTTA